MENVDATVFAAMVERDLLEGTKHVPEDLEKMLSTKLDFYSDKPHWRHKESGTVYDFVGLSLASTGSGQLVTMVHFRPVDHPGPNLQFGRQEALFVERFEPVYPDRVWVTA